MRLNACLSVALRDHPGHAGSREEGSVYVAQDAYGLQRADISRVHPVVLSYRESENPRVYVASTLSRTLRSSARPRSIQFPENFSFACYIYIMDVDG